MQEIIDRVLFNMPKDKELQFLAMAIVQQFVNFYKIRKKAFDVDPSVSVSYTITETGKVQESEMTQQTKNNYVLHYWLNMPDEDKKLFDALQVDLIHAPTQFAEPPDAVFEFTDETAKALYNPNRHASQAYAALCGAGKAILLRCLLIVKPRIENPHWLHLDHDDWTDATYPNKTAIFEEQILSAKDYELTGVIGTQGYLTYLAACRSIPVVEIIPQGRSEHFMSKHVLRYYRKVRWEQNQTLLRELVQRAMVSVENQLLFDMNSGKFSKEPQQEVSAAAAKTLQEIHSVDV